MTALAAHPLDAETQSQLDLFTDTSSPLGVLHFDDFRKACEDDAAANDGWIHPSRVSALLHDRFRDIKPNAFSGFWNSACAKNGFMDKADVEEPIDGTHSKGNGNKKVPLRRLRPTP